MFSVLPFDMTIEVSHSHTAFSVEVAAVAQRGRGPSAERCIFCIDWVGSLGADVVPCQTARAWAESQQPARHRVSHASQITPPKPSDPNSSRRSTNSGPSAWRLVTNRSVEQFLIACFHRSRLQRKCLGQLPVTSTAVDGCERSLEPAVELRPRPIGCGPGS